MKTALIVFSSSVSGSRLKYSAQKEKIYNIKITQTPSDIKSNGCSYSLRILVSDLDKIINIAKRNNIPFSGVYKERYDSNGHIFYERIYS